MARRASYDGFPMRCRSLISAALALCVTAPLAAQETYVIDSTHTTPMFEIGHLGGISQQRGFFTNATGKVTLDRAAKRGSIDIAIGTGSVMTASRVLTDVLKREDYFNAEKFPVMTFTSRDLVFEGDVPVGANGELTLLGVTRPVALKITSFKCATHPYNRRPICGRRSERHHPALRIRHDCGYSGGGERRGADCHSGRGAARVA